MGEDGSEGLLFVGGGEDAFGDEVVSILGHENQKHFFAFLPLVIICPRNDRVAIIRVDAKVLFCDFTFKWLGYSFL